MKAGIVGLAGAGKTTVFNALTGLSAEVGPGGRERANVGVIKVPDSRVDELADLYKPKKRTYAEISFVDVAVPGDQTSGAAEGPENGLDPKIVQHMREVDALVHVVRAFDNPMLARAANPAGDIKAFEDELILTDLVQVENRLARLKKERDSGRERELFERLKSELESERPLRNVALSTEEQVSVAGFRFLSQKPLLILVNTSEDQIGSGPAPGVMAAAAEKGFEAISMPGKTEMEIAELGPEEQAEFLEALGIDRPARERFIQAAYRLLDLISFLTAGEDECRAWPIMKGTHAQKAAGKIHSDIERGFIRAEVVRFEDLISQRSIAACREHGKLRLEGKEYVVQDGDVINFRFNV